MSPPIRRAILSVSNKQGLAEFARGLAEAGVQLYSTGGTGKFLAAAGLAVEEISAYTGFPEMMDGRIKTLHPKVHGGILCRHDHPEDLRAMAEHGIVPFELVVVNLYPFEATAARSDATPTEVIEQIDIGGPTLVRAAAKNHAFTAIVTRPEQYGSVLDEIRASGSTSAELRRTLAVEAFAQTARYDQAIADYLSWQLGAAPQQFPAMFTLRLARREVLRYGENPHQHAALYLRTDISPTGLMAGRQLHGKELSYNNLLDLSSALAIARSLEGAAAAVIKHNNPCGAAMAASLAEAARGALEGDPVSAFGSVLGFNRHVDAETAEVLCEPGRFIEAIAAPEFAPEALEILTTRPKWRENVRLVEVGPLEQRHHGWELRAIDGGFLVQDPDVLPDDEHQWQVVTDRRPTAEQWEELRFAWALVRHVKSNAIVVSRQRALVGVGAGQMSRVDSVEIALKKAGERGRGSALASDAFFPFADSIELAAQSGVAAVIQPGGSRRDDEVIASCNRHGLPMVFTGRRHFKH